MRQKPEAGRDRVVEALNAELEKKERELAQAQSLARMGDWKCEPPFVEMSGSEQFLRIFGLEERSIPIGALFSTLEIGYRELAESMMSEMLQTGKAMELECKVLTPAGEDKNVLLRGAAEKDGQGSLVRVYGTVQDISEKKLAEDQLRIQRDLAVEVAGAETLEEAAALSVFGAMEITNTECGALYLLDEDGESLSLLFREGFSDTVLESVARGGQSLLETADSAVRVPLRVTGGFRFIVLFPLSFRSVSFGFIALGSKEKTRLQEAGALAMESLAAQISNGIRQKQSEDARKLSEERYRGLFESMINGVTRNDEDGYYLEANRAFLEMVGYSERELKELRFRDITPEESLEKEIISISGELNEKGYSEEYEKEYLRKDGTRVSAAVKIWSTRRIDTGTREYWAVVQDITERKEQEQLIEKALQDLKRSNDELRDFAYSASHDLQEPLRSIMGFSELLERRYGDKLDEGGIRFLGLIIGAAQRMQLLIDDLLSYSRLNTEARPFELIDLDSVLETVKLNLLVMLEEQQAGIEASPLPQIYADPVQIPQLFQNLISNAVKYRRNDVPLRVRITGREEGGYLHFTVEDNGIGIQEEHLDIIFKMFQRLHNREEYSGTGIGLALCRRIVERHGGSIWAESEYGKGTAFHFTLPKRDNAAA